MADSVATTVVSPTTLVAGGDALARDTDGRVLFVRGALPNEEVEVEVVEQRRDFARARVVSVITRSPARVEPRCPAVAQGCGGCDLAYADASVLPALKAGLVVDALRRLGRVEEPSVRVGPTLSPFGFRTTVRAAVREGRAGFRRAREHEVIHPEHCLITHPALDELLVEGSFGEASEVTLRMGGTTGERLALVSPSAAGVHLPEDVRVVGLDEIERGRRAWFHDEVVGRRWRISAGSFFQSRTDGAEVLVGAVRAAAIDVLRDPAVLLDAYSGVGLFAGALGAGRRVFAVESSSSAAADARRNLADLDAKVLRTAVERLRAPQADLVVADPARTGLGNEAVAALVRTGARRIVLVSCDPAALGRDTRLLREAGYRFHHATLVDLFPHTHHVEVVSRFDLAES